jgi:hypothetical protein
MAKLIGIYLIAVSHLSNIVPLAVPEGEVSGGGAEVEAVYLPAGFTGPIVAAPFDVKVF